MDNSSDDEVFLSDGAQSGGENQKTRHNSNRVRTLPDDETVKQMVFTSCEEADLFYINYGREMGFDVRKCSLGMSKDKSVLENNTWQCVCAGFPKELSPTHQRIRTERVSKKCGCLARFRISLDRHRGFYRVTGFCSSHNHALATAETKDGLKSSRHVIFYCMLVTLTISFWLITSNLNAAKRLHDSMIHSILKAHMLFFHTNPIGRVINRFAKDLSDIDRDVANFVDLFLSHLFQVLSTFVLIGFVSTISLWAILPLLILFYSAYLYYQSTSREIKRLDSITRSPVYAQFGEALNGLSTIRAYKAYDRMTNINGKSVDKNIRFTYVNTSSNRWLSIRLETLGGDHDLVDHHLCSYAEQQSPKPGGICIHNGPAS